MKDNIRKFKTYAAWEYEKEEQDLNRHSQEGLQLVKGGLFPPDLSKTLISAIFTSWTTTQAFMIWTGILKSSPTRAGSM